MAAHIATAPKNGETILGWTGDLVEGKHGIRHLIYDMAWCLVGYPSEEYQPTHWMPLPAAPVRP